MLHRVSEGLTAGSILTDRVLFGVLLGAYMKVKVAFNHLDVVFRVRVLLAILLMGDQSKM